MPFVGCRQHPAASALHSGAVLQSVLLRRAADDAPRYGSGCRSIFFAISKDLKNWTRLAFKPPPANDTEVFKYTVGGLGGTAPGYTIGGCWDCISTVPKPGTFCGFRTASPSGTGGAGVGETIDQTGHH